MAILFLGFIITACRVQSGAARQRGSPTVLDAADGGQFLPEHRHAVAHLVYAQHQEVRLSGVTDGLLHGIMWVDELCAFLVELGYTSDIRCFMVLQKLNLASLELSASRKVSTGCLPSHMAFQISATSPTIPSNSASSVPSTRGRTVGFPPSANELLEKTSEREGACHGGVSEPMSAMGSARGCCREKRKRSHGS